jgi:hypothetical protein
LTGLQTFSTWVSASAFLWAVGSKPALAARSTSCVILSFHCRQVPLVKALDSSNKWQPISFVMVTPLLQPRKSAICKKEMLTNIPKIIEMVYSVVYKKACVLSNGAFCSHTAGMSWFQTYCGTEILI